MRCHDLKTWPEYFFAVAMGQKTFEVCKDDRNFEVGDKIRLREWDPKTGEYTGSVCYCPVIYKLDGGQFGVEASYCVLGLGGDQARTIYQEKD